MLESIGWCVTGVNRVIHVQVRKRFKIFRAVWFYPIMNLTSEKTNNYNSVYIKRRSVNLLVYC